MTRLRRAAGRAVCLTPSAAHERGFVLMMEIRDSALPVCLAFENVVSHAATTLFSVCSAHTTRLRIPSPAIRDRSIPAPSQSGPADWLDDRIAQLQMASADESYPVRGRVREKMPGLLLSDLRVARVYIEITARALLTMLDSLDCGCRSYRL